MKSNKSLKKFNLTGKIFYFLYFFYIFFNFFKGFRKNLIEFAKSLLINNTLIEIDFSGLKIEIILNF